VTKSTISDNRQRKAHELINTNLTYFSKYALKIRDKSGNLVPFVFNRAQEFLHAALEDQKKAIGRIRALIVKGRQQGCSTYIAARFYHRSTRRKGQAVFILSHEAETTKKLFAIVERFQQNIPELLKPQARIANRREFKFDNIDSEYAVGTAGNEDVGRGGTVQMFHGSEAAYWDNPDGIVTGVMQSVPDLDETELILESTGNGMDEMFYSRCMDALEKAGIIESVEEGLYRLTPSKNFVKTQEGVAQRSLFQNVLKDGQCAFDLLPGGEAAK